MLSGIGKFKFPFITKKDKAKETRRTADNEWGINRIESHLISQGTKDVVAVDVGTAVDPHSWT